MSELFHLIKSLSKSEKRYFNVFASRHKIGDGNNYTRLFNLINKQKLHDERALLRLLKNDPLSKNFRYNKHYLKELILKSLHFYHSSNSADSKIKERLHYVEILYEKGLFEQCKKELKKIKQLAYEYELYLYVLEVLQWEARTELSLGRTDKDIRSIFKEEQKALDIINNLSHYSLLTSKMFIKIRKGGLIRAKQELKAFEYIIKHPLIENKKKANSYHSQYLYYLIRSTYFFIHSDFANAHLYTHHLISFLERYPHQISRSAKPYVFALHNLLICQLHLQKLNEFHDTLSKLRKVTPRTEAVKLDIFYSSYNLELTMFIITGQFEKGLNLTNDIEEQLTQWVQKRSDPREILLLYQVTLIFFGRGDYDKASKHLTRILNYSHIEIRSDIYCFARILNLINHYELGNEDILEYIVKSTYRFLYKRNRLYKFETSILKFIRKEIPKIISERDLIKAFNKLKTELEEIVKDPFEQKMLEYFDFISWLESKIENKSFAEIIREKTNN